MGIDGLSNLSELVSLRMYQRHHAAMARSFNRLATGRRINGGADDPAGLIASEQLSATLAAIEAQTAANERAISKANTADAALGEISGLLTEARTRVAANANSAGLSAEEKAANQLEIDSILDSVDRIATTTRFNAEKLLDGNATVSAWGSSLAIESPHSSTVGKTTADGTEYSLGDLRSGKALSTIGDKTDVAASVLGQAISDIATQRGRLGAYSRHTLESNLGVLAAQQVNLSSALSMIRDTNYAAETAALSRSGILARSALTTGRLISIFA